MNLNAYFLWTVGALLAGMVLAWFAGKQMPAGLKVRTLLLAVPLGILGARAFYVLARLNFFAEIGGTVWLWPADPMWSDWGVGLGFALWGAVGGTALAAVISTKKGTDFRKRMMDALAAGGCLAVGLYRFGEFLIGEGTGEMVEAEELCFFPLAVMNEWEEWNYAVFVWEGIAALVICFILLNGMRRRKPGVTARLFLILFCSSQILLESLRRDSFLRWMFVRVSQVTAAAVLAGLIAAAVIRVRGDASEWGRRKRGMIVSCAVFLFCIGICVGLEFAMDKSAFLSLELCYALEALCCIGLGTAAYRAVICTDKNVKKT